MKIGDLSLLQLVRPEILELKAYSSARSLISQGQVSGTPTYLDANESSNPPLSYQGMNRYPDPQPLDLLNLFSSLFGFPAENLLLSRGADEAIDIVTRTFCRAGQDAILICPPTYGMYKVSAQIQGAKVIELPLDSGNFSINKDLLLNIVNDPENSVKIVYLCSPNNPTGTQYSSDFLINLSLAIGPKAILVIDEAYADFSEEGGLLPKLNQASLETLYPNVIILRTMSKSWALAGARCGITIAHRDLIRIFQKIRAPYPLSLPSIEIIREVLTQWKVSGMRDNVAKVKEEKEFVKAELQKMNRVEKVYPSQANFVLLKLGPDYCAEKIVNVCRSKGVIIRSRHQDFGLANCIRMTIGTRSENLAALEGIQNA